MKPADERTKLAFGKNLPEPSHRDDKIL